MEHSRLPPPPSRTQQNPYGGNGGHGYGYDSPRGPPGSSSTSHFNGSDPYVDNPYHGYTNSRNGSANLGVVNPNEIVDDGDDGLVYGKSQRNSMLSLSNSDRAKRGASATAAAVGGGAAAGGLLGGRGQYSSAKCAHLLIRYRRKLRDEWGTGKALRLWLRR